MAYGPQPLTCTRHMHGLAAVADEMTPIAERADDQELAQLSVAREPDAVLFRRGGALAERVDPPIAEILAQLQPAIDDRIGQIALLVLGRAALAQRAVVGLTRRRQRHQARSAGDQQIVADIHVMAGTVLGVVFHARALRTVGFAAELADLPGHVGAAQEGGNLLGQQRRREAADQPVAGGAPGERALRRRAERDDRQRQGHGQIAKHPRTPGCRVGFDILPITQPGGLAIPQS
ncbi:MAG: hypothetical protein WDO24_11695 [Pseudomonadota bacterium]